MENWSDLLATNKWSTVFTEDVSVLSVFESKLSYSVSTHASSAQPQNNEKTLDVTKPKTPSQHSDGPVSDYYRTLVDVPLHVSRRVKHSGRQIVHGSVCTITSRRKRSDSVFGTLISRDFMVGILNTCNTRFVHTDKVNFNAMHSTLSGT